MKFASIFLSNYIGIYNGMGLYDIHIDMTKCKNRITIIRGDNGSGKSTISKAMNLFPDSNDSFIPGMDARKEIVLVDGETLYKLVFVHNVKSNGDRDVTKAYITKTFNGQAIELNENGNVSSYKDILYTELGMDANFSALSQLSNDDRGLADKKPAERKKFVNSIISSLDTYNDIYKTLTKRSSNYKSMINAIVGKLNILGDEKVLNDSLLAVESKINTIQDLKDKAITVLAKEESIIQLLDPDGSIQNSNTTINAELHLAEKDFETLQKIIDKISSENSINYKNIDGELKSLQDKKNSLTVANQINRNRITTMLQQKDQEAVELDQKIQQLQKMKSNHNLENLKNMIDEYEKDIDSIKTVLKDKVGIENIDSINKDEYILALETLKDLESNISTFKSFNDYSIIEKIISLYISTNSLPPTIDIISINTNIKNLCDIINDLNFEINSIQGSLDLLDILTKRPKGCKDDNCAFIKNALEFNNTKPLERLKSLERDLAEKESYLNDLDKEKKYAEEFNNALNMFSVIVREVEKNGSILSKMPNGDMFKQKNIFLDKLLSGYSFEYMKQIYQYIDLANLFDVYAQKIKIYKELIDEYKLYESKIEIIDSINADIDKINKSISGIMEEIETIQQEIFDIDKQIAELESRESIYNNLLLKIKDQIPYKEKMEECKAKLLENSRKMNEINAAILRAQTARESINQYSYELEPLMKERDKINHSVQMMHDYIVEKEELENNYKYLETIKYYSSPTTGIQLVFMELYMGKIIALANDLLRLLFNGQFVIQPFVINESEFRIPCLGSGYLNDDISSMSSAQISMISMILSFALLHHSSTNYNIIKLDEIDGPLDYNNRLFFIDVLNNIMDIMGTEQCIMISHNSELQVDNSDVILLKHDTSNTDYMRGNIIWSY